MATLVAVYVWTAGRAYKGRTTDAAQGGWIIYDADGMSVYDFIEDEVRDGGLDDLESAGYGGVPSAAPRETTSRELAALRHMSRLTPERQKSGKRANDSPAFSPVRRY